MKTWQLSEGIDRLPDHIRAVHHQLVQTFGQCGESMPRVISIACCETDDDDRIYEISFELAPGVVLSTTYGSPAEIEGSSLPEGSEHLVAQEAERTVRDYRAMGVDGLADMLHDLRLRSRRTLASITTDGWAGSLVDVRLTASNWHGAYSRKVIVTLEAIDEDLSPFLDELLVGDVDGFDAALREWCAIMAIRYAARRALALDGATGAIDLLTLNAISTFEDPKAWIRALRSGPRPSPDNITIFLKDWMFHSHGSDATSPLAWNRSIVRYPITLPDTVLMACTGRPITDLIQHPLLSREMTILSASCVVKGDDHIVSIEIDQPRLLFCHHSGRTWERRSTLERFSPELNQRGFTRPWFSDSRSVLAKEAGMDGSSFIA